MRMPPLALLALLLACQSPPDSGPEGSISGDALDGGLEHNAGASVPDAGAPPPAVFRCSTSGGALLREFDFRQGLLGWSGGFADYPPENADIYELRWSLEPLPAELRMPGTGFFITGNNRSSDLFMFLKARVDGLQASARYAVTFELEFATEAGAGCVGPGGAAESVTVKAGAVPFEPATLLVGNQARMNLDKGNQTAGGENAEVLGSVAHPDSACAGGTFRLKTLASRGALAPVSASADGSLWLLVGTDSGSASVTRLYYTRVRACFAPAT